MSMGPDELEYAISQRLDGTLPLPDQERLRRALDADPSARLLEAKYLRLDAITRSLGQGLHCDEEALARSISNAIDRLHAEADNAVEDESDRALARAIASFSAEQPRVDLDALARRIEAGIDAIERERQASEAGAGEYGSLDELLRTSLPVPVAAALPPTLVLKPAAETWRIGRWARPLAVAASLLIVATLAVVLLRNDPANTGTMPVANPATGAPGIAAGGTGVQPLNVAAPIESGTSRPPDVRVAEFEVARPDGSPRPRSASADLTVGNGTTLPASRWNELFNESLFREPEPRIEPPNPGRQ